MSIHVKNQSRKVIREVFMEKDTIQADNLSEVIEEPSIDDDNSDNIADDEPDYEESEEETPDKSDSETKEKILGKFSTDEEVRNSYLELEKKTTQLSQEKSQWEKEKSELSEKAKLAEHYETQQNELAKMYGFNSSKELENYQNELKFNNQLASYTADEYIKHLNDVDYPDDVKGMLLQYKQNPTKDLLENIEAEFPLERIKQVAENTALLKGQLATQQQQAQANEERTYLESYLQDTITKHKDIFEDKTVINLFGEAFKMLGAFDSDIFIQHIKDVQKSAIQNYLSKKQVNKENSDIQSAIEGLSPSKNVAGTSEKNILDMSPDEMQREFKKYKE